MYLCSGVLSMTSTSCVTPSKTSTVASLTCRRRVTPETQIREAKMIETLSHTSPDVTWTSNKIFAYITMLYAWMKNVIAIFSFTL